MGEAQLLAIKAVISKTTITKLSIIKWYLIQSLLWVK
jgi:hypothetical protein